MSTRFQASFLQHQITNLYSQLPKIQGLSVLYSSSRLKIALTNYMTGKRVEIASIDCIRSVQGKLSISIMVNGLHLYTVVPFCLTRLFLPIKHNLIHQWWRGCSGRQWPGNYGETVVLLKDTWKCKTGGAKTWILLVNWEHIFPKSHQTFDMADAVLQWVLQYVATQHLNPWSWDC